MYAYGAVGGIKPSEPATRLRMNGRGEGGGLEVVLRGTDFRHMQIYHTVYRYWAPHL